MHSLPTIALATDPIGVNSPEYLYLYEYMRHSMKWGSEMRPGGKYKYLLLRVQLCLLLQLTLASGGRCVQVRE